MKRTAYETWVDSLAVYNNRQLCKSAHARVISPKTFGEWLVTGQYTNYGMDKDAGIWDSTKAFIGKEWDSEHPIASIGRTMARPAKWAGNLAWNHGPVGWGRKVIRNGADVAKQLRNGEVDMGSEFRHKLHDYTKFKADDGSVYERPDNQDMNDAVARGRAQGEKSGYFKTRSNIRKYDKLRKDMAEWDQYKNTDLAADYVLQHYGGDRARAAKFMEAYGKMGTSKVDKLNRLEAINLGAQGVHDNLIEGVTGWIPNIMGLRTGLNAALTWRPGMGTANARRKRMAELYGTNTAIGNLYESAVATPSNIAGAVLPAVAITTMTMGAGAPAAAAKLGLTKAVAGTGTKAALKRYAMGAGTKALGTLGSKNLALAYALGKMDQSAAGHNFANSMATGVQDWTSAALIPGMGTAGTLAYYTGMPMLQSFGGRTKEELTRKITAAHPELLAGKAKTPQEEAAIIRGIVEENPEIAPGDVRDIVYNMEGNNALDSLRAEEKKRGNVDLALRDKRIYKAVADADRLGVDFWASDEFKSLPSQRRSELMQLRLKKAMAQDWYAGNSRIGGMLSMGWNAMTGKAVDKIVQQAADRGESSRMYSELAAMAPTMAETSIDAAIEASKTGAKIGMDPKATSLLSSISKYGTDAQRAQVYAGLGRMDDKKLGAFLDMIGSSGANMDDPGLRALASNEKFRSDMMQFVITPKLMNPQSSAYLLPRAMSMISSGSANDPAMAKWRDDILQMARAKPNWSETFKSMAPKDMMRTAEALAGLGASAASPEIMQAFGGPEEYAKFTEDFGNKVKAGVRQALFRDPTTMHRAVALWMDSKNMPGVADKVRSNPFLFYATVIGAIGAAGYGAYKMISGGPQPQEQVS